MRPLPILSAIILTAATPASAQVTVDLHALQALPDHPGVTRLPRPEHLPVVQNRPTPARHEAMVTPPTTTPTVPATATPAAPTAAALPAIPQAAPTTASIAPITPPPPAAGTQPPAPPVVSASATTKAAPTASGLRLIFAPGESDLSPESGASIKQLAAGPLGEMTTFNVLAYAPGKPDDPSTARRVSLSRAMSVRGALIADGVPSARVFVRALGEQYGKGPPDRVDISVMGANAPADTAPASAPPASTATAR